jgi:superfamily II DNA/RNA helicase
MKKFRANSADLLIATDVAARGLDVQHVSHVVNYDVPAPRGIRAPHRAAPAARAAKGVAITLAEPREHRLLRNIEQQTKQRIEIAAVPTVADLRARPPRAHTRVDSRDHPRGRSRSSSVSSSIRWPGSSTSWTWPRRR